MSILRVEQLEPRQLLSGGCFPLQSSPRPISDAGSPFPRVAERRSFVDFGQSHFGSDTPTWTHPFDVRHAGPTLVAVRFPIGNDGPPRSGPGPIGGPGVSDIADSGGPTPAAVVAGRGPAGMEVPHETNLAAAASAAPPRMNLPPATLLDLAGAAALRLTLPALLAVAPPLSPTSGREDVSVAPTTGSPGQWLRDVNAVTADPGQPRLAPPELPPALSTVLSVLSPIDLADLERGLRQFVGQLESAGRSLLRPVERGEFWPWIVAAAAALAACEIARREFRSQEPRGPSLDFSDL